MEKWNLRSFSSSFLMAGYLLTTSIQGMEEKENAYWSKVPVEILGSIVSSQDEKIKQRVLSQREILKLAEVCKNLNGMIKNPELWVILSEQDGFGCHPNTAFRAHYNFWKASALVDKYNLLKPDSNDQENKELSSEKALEIITCLNQGAPYMHLGAIDILMKLMNSPKIPLDIPCIQLPKDLNLNVYPLLSQDALIGKSDEELLEICSGYASDITRNSPVVLERLFWLLKEKNLDCVVFILDQLKKSNERISSNFPCPEELRMGFYRDHTDQSADYFMSHKEEILVRIERAKLENDYITIDFLIGSLDNFAESCLFSSSPNKVDPFVSTRQEAKEIIDTLVDFISKNVPLDIRSKMKNYQRSLLDQINNLFVYEKRVDICRVIITDLTEKFSTQSEQDKKGDSAKPVLEKAIENLDKHSGQNKEARLDLEKFMGDLTNDLSAVLDKKNFVLLGNPLEIYKNQEDSDDPNSPAYLKAREKFESSIFPILRVGHFSPMMIVEFEYIIQDGFMSSINSGFYLYSLCKQFYLTHPKLCFFDWPTGLYCDWPDVDKTSPTYISDQRNYITMVSLLKISIGNKVNVHLLKSILHTQPEDFPEQFCQKYVDTKFNDLIDFQNHLAQLYRPKLLELVDSSGIVEDKDELAEVNYTLGMISARENDWEKAKEYFLTVDRLGVFYKRSPIDSLIDLNKLDEAQDLLNTIDPDETNDDLSDVREWLEELKNDEG